MIGILGAANVQAQPSDRFPESTTTHIGGERYEAFDLGGFRELLSIDAELRSSLLLLDNLENQVQQYRLIEVGYQIALDATEVDLAIVQADRERLFELWKEENKNRLEAENRPRIGSWLGWGIAGAFGVATLVLSLILGLAR